MTSLSDDGQGLRYLGRVSCAYDDAGFGVDEEPAQAAAKECFGEDRSLPEAGLGVDLFLELSLAARAPELSVERVLDPGFWSQLIFVPFDEPKSQFGIHLFEHAHDAIVAGRNN